jgi:hypothetical protein
MHNYIIKVYIITTAFCVILTTCFDTFVSSSGHRRRLRVVSGATAPGPALEGARRFRPKVVLMSLSSIPIEIPIL